ncbi:MAG TPA: isoaspartyl peptidase/L-asparaginase [Croceibacterium sp.]|nr:isoaspartyl peptidase/L-asparaginase [Croceibacterium sp.]
MVARPVPEARWAIAIHGGAGTMARAAMSQADQGEYRAGLALALDAGVAVLAAGGGALDAVEAAVVALEDDAHFNAGRGSVFTYDGVIELDASIMDGRGRQAGAVTGLRRVRNPVGLARAVMEDGRHVFLSGDGAEAFARERGIVMADPEWFATSERRRQLDEVKARGAGFDAGVKYGTVGAVAVDREGHVAAATSTGGLTGKRWGRIGDSPVIGAGNYADDRACAVSATGSGEYFIRAGVAHEIAARMRLLGESAQAAADAVIAEVGALGGDGGVIVAAPDGSIAFAFNTPGMYRAQADSVGLREVAIFAGE